MYRFGIDAYVPVFIILTRLICKLRMVINKQQNKDVNLKVAKSSIDTSPHYQYT